MQTTASMPGSRCPAGFGLVELMVALALSGLIALAAIASH